jgi:sigma-B regulation protein RsbU (phosphoserine phosphatase)
LDIADVSGKGLEAAIYAAKCKFMLRGTAFESPGSPSAAFSKLNDLLCYYDDNLFFVTAFYAVIDTTSWQMTYVNAGHPPPVLMTHGGKMQTMLYKTGAPLGFESGLHYSEKTVSFDPGCGVFLYTDGIIETRGKKPMLDIEGLQDLLFELAASEPQELAESVCESATAYSDGKLRDDAAVVTCIRAWGAEIISVSIEEQSAVASI